MSKQVTLTIDGRQITADENATILQAALDNGIYIPHLCSHDNLHPVGACRMCVVGVAGEKAPVTACAALCQEGMVVDTQDEMAEKIRRLSCDFMFKTHPAECTSCPKFGKCELQSISQYVGDTGRKLKAHLINIKADNDNPIILHEMYRCILCGRCVRACGELRGVGAIQFAKVNGRERVVIDGQSLEVANCRFCGACVEVCPTGSIREHKEIADQMIGQARDEGLVPCKRGCPAHIDVPRYIRFIQEGNYAAANAVVREKAPFPHSLGFICVHPCETECKRHYLNQPIAIRNLKRFAAEHDDGSWKHAAFRKPETDKRIAVVGGGPAGLTAGYFGAKLGHRVTIFEAREKLGGQMRYGIPGYRLPRAVLEDEIHTIVSDERIVVCCGQRIDHPARLLLQGYDAVFVAVGTHQGIRLPIPGSDFAGVLLNTDFLRDFEEGKANTGQRVVILGGGNVAMDCAGAALRLGAQEVRMVCLESYGAMTAAPEEREEALEEGLQLFNNSTFSEITGEGGHCTGVRIQQVENFRQENGRFLFDKREETEKWLEADTVIFATGQRPEIPADGSFGLALTHGNYIAASGRGETSVPGVWAAGDAVTGTQSVIKALAFAREAIVAIDQYLGGDGNLQEHLAPEQARDPWIGKIAGFGGLQRVAARMVPAQMRVTDYQSCGPMDQGFDEAMAWQEAKRCLQCDLRCDISAPRFWSDYGAKDGEQA